MKTKAALALLFLVFCAQLSRRTEIPVATPQPVPAPPSVKAAVVGSRPQDLREWVRQGAKNLAEGKQIAEARRESMLALMATNAAEAISQSLTWNEFAALAPELQAIVEKPFSRAMNFEVLPTCPPKGGGNSIAQSKGLSRRVFMDGEWKEAFVFGAKAQITSKVGLPLRGFELGGKVALAESSVERLEGDNLAAARQIFPNGSVTGVSYTSGKPVGADGRTVLFNGALYELASEAEENEFAEMLLTAEKSLNPKAVVMALDAGKAASGTIAFDVNSAKKSGPIANSTWTETPKTALALRISYSDGRQSGFTLTQLTNLVVSSSNALKTMSYGKTYLIPRVVAITLPLTVTDYEGQGPDKIATDSATVLSGMGINRDDYDIVIHAHPTQNFAYAGLGVVGGANNWLNGSVGVEVLTHEVGHNYGLGHAHYRAMTTGLGSFGHTQSDGSSLEYEDYGDAFDIMGNIASLPAGHYGAHGKAALNWIEPKEVINVVTNGIYRIFRHDYIGARTNVGTKLALKVTGSGEEYWVSHRKLFTSNATQGKGANIVRADGNADQSLVDTTPLSKGAQAYETDREDSALLVGKPFTDSLGTIRITTIASAGTTPFEYIDVQVAFLNTGAYSFYTGIDFKTNGLVGSYVNSDMRSRATQDDWRSTVTIAGKRIDPVLSFTSDGWGARAPLHLTSGTDANWDNFSVQWDGYIVVRRPIRLATISDDSSRFWIDLNNNNVFSSVAPEFVNNHWGTGQGPTRGDLSGIIPPGTYRIRIQYEEGNGGNYFVMTGTDLPFQLFTTAAATTPGLTASYVAKSLGTSTSQSDWRVTQTIAGSRVETFPGFTINSLGLLSDVGLTAGVNGSDDNWDGFSIQWDGFLSNSVPIKMATVSDDYSRMWIDVNTNGTFSPTSPEYINNGWGGTSGQGFTSGNATTLIPPGLYAMRIQYQDGAGDNRFLIEGAPQFPADAVALFGVLSFTGSETVTAVRKIAGDFTIEFWMRSTQVTGGESVWTDGAGLVDANVPPGNGFGVSLGNGKVLFGVSGGTPVTIQSTFAADDVWHFVSARRVQSSGELTLFVDGIEMARGVGGTELLDSAVNLTLGAQTDGTHNFLGMLDIVKAWDTARTQEQVMADFELSRSGHSFVDGAPTVRLARTPNNSVQVFWDPISSYRILEGSPTVDGTFVTLPTDQNSTNLVFGSNPMRFFRVRK